MTSVALPLNGSSSICGLARRSPGPKCSVKVTPEKDGQYKFVIKNAGGANTVTFNVKVAK